MIAYFYQIHFCMTVLLVPYLPNDARDAALVYLYYKVFLYFICILFFPHAHHIVRLVAIQ